ncbi:hypothetical protein [Vibrio hangzhouensis]|uniref:Uncharacterized protein n=1 Tax=Vibrio hangzhouensis TaxID=462991 RepID=A0A1H5YD89_9VIBR|nr:hypothetical protein [Vibrio hangzhouensis]SEG21732.1 hypothetical protein SAMN04488244_10916 [Vibrio hangzhouensis]
MSVLFWKSQIEDSFIANCGEANVRFDAFELETIEGNLWLYRKDVVVCCIRSDGGSDKLHRYAARLNKIGATNYGEPVYPCATQIRKQDEAPEVLTVDGADSSTN